MSKFFWKARINRAAVLADRASPFDLRTHMIGISASEYEQIWCLYLALVGVTEQWFPAAPPPRQRRHSHDSHN